MFAHRSRNRFRRALLPASTTLLLSIATQTIAAPLLVPQIQVGKPIHVLYHCPGGTDLRVTYLNSGDGQSFAVMPVKGKPTLLVNTMSADGVRYQSGFITWWSKGKGGSYYDASVDPNKPVLADCTSD